MGRRATDHTRQIALGKKIYDQGTSMDENLLVKKLFNISHNDTEGWIDENSEYKDAQLN
jgi:hypothetical protein